jgi:hypothetical protein
MYKKYFYIFVIFMFFVCLTIPLVAQQRLTPSLSPATKSSINEDSPRLKQLKGVFSQENSVDRKLDKKAMSVRWTGKIQVPATGNYVFQQVSSLYGNSKVKLWIDGQLVLDTHGKNNRNSFPESNTVPLTAGKPSDFRLEFSHRNFGKRDFPIAALTWKSEVLDRQIIPPAAFIVTKGSAGLNGEYFADENFKRKAFTRVDESVEFIWDQGSVEKHFAAESRKTMKLLNKSYGAKSTKKIQY